MGPTGHDDSSSALPCAGCGEPVVVPPGVCWSCGAAPLLTVLQDSSETMGALRGSGKGTVSLRSLAEAQRRAAESTLMIGPLRRSRERTEAARILAEAVPGLDPDQLLRRMRLHRLLVVAMGVAPAAVRGLTRRLLAAGVPVFTAGGRRKTFPVGALAFGALAALAGGWGFHVTGDGWVLVATFAVVFVVLLLSVLSAWFQPGELVPRSALPVGVVDDELARAVEALARSDNPGSRRVLDAARRIAQVLKRTHPGPLAGAQGWNSHLGEAVTAAVCAAAAAPGGAEGVAVALEDVASTLARRGGALDAQALAQLESKVRRAAAAATGRAP